MAEALPPRSGAVARHRRPIASGSCTRSPIATAGGLASLPSSEGANVTVVPMPIPDRDTSSRSTWASSRSTGHPRPTSTPARCAIRAVVGTATAATTTCSRCRSRSRSFGDATSRAARWSCRPTSDAPLEFTHTLLERAEFAAGDDRHRHRRRSAADRRPAYLWLSADEAITVTVVNGDPSELRAHDEVFFLATAVGVTDREQRLRPDQPRARSARGARSATRASARSRTSTCWCWPTCARRPRTSRRPCSRRSSAAWAFGSPSGDRVDPEAYNARLGAALPLRMREVVQVGTAPGRTAARVEGFAPPDLVASDVPRHGRRAGAGERARAQGRPVRSRPRRVAPRSRWRTPAARPALLTRELRPDASRCSPPASIATGPTYRCGPGSCRCRPPCSAGSGTSARAHVRRGSSSASRVRSTVAPRSWWSPPMAAS